MNERRHPTRRDALRLIGGKLADVLTPAALQDPITPERRRVGRLDLPIMGAVGGAVMTSLIAKEPKEIPVAVAAGAIIGFVTGAAFDRYFGIAD